MRGAPSAPRNQDPAYLTCQRQVCSRLPEGWGETVAGARAGDLDAGPWIEAYNAPLRSSAGQFKLVWANRFQGIVSGLAEAGLNHTPMLLAGLPPKDAMLWLIADELRPPPAGVESLIGLRSTKNHAIALTIPIGAETDDKDKMGLSRWP
jgi:hypothetical protein